MAPPEPPGLAPPPGIEGPDLHHDIARDIGHQVEGMILDAKHASETRVGKEIQKIKQMLGCGRPGEKIKLINDRVAAVDNSKAPVLQTELLASIAKLEEVWEGKDLSVDNTSSSQRDAIDQVQGRMTESAPWSLKVWLRVFGTPRPLRVEAAHHPIPPPATREGRSGR
eukprot:Skav231748  [mRNA]  locus=scaffold695:7059:16537:- [translate_table: standard]